MAEEQQGQSEGPAGEAKVNPIVKYFKDFGVLRETKREYWGLQVINALDCLAYFAMFNIAVVTLSRDFGFTDAWAGYIYTIFSGLTTIFLFFSGVITDWLGIKRALYIAMIGLLLTRVGVVLTEYMDEPVRMSADTPISELYDGHGIEFVQGHPDLQITARDNTTFEVDFFGAQTIGAVLQLINDAPGNDGRIEARIAPGWTSLRLIDHMAEYAPEAEERGLANRIAVHGTEWNPDAAKKLGLEEDGDPQRTLDGDRIITDLNDVAVSELNQGAGLRGGSVLSITDRWGTSFTVDDLQDQEMVGDIIDRVDKEAKTAGALIEVDFNTPGNGLRINDLNGRLPLRLDTPLADLHTGEGVPISTDPARPDVTFIARDGSEYNVSLTGSSTIGDVIERVREATAGHIELGLINEMRLIVTDMRPGEGEVGKLRVTGPDEEGREVARKLGILKERGVNRITFDGSAIPYVRIEREPGGELRTPSHPLTIEGDAAAPLGFEKGANGSSYSGENIIVNKLRSYLTIGLLACMAPFMAMLITVFQAGNRRFTTNRSRGAGFNLWYLFMNVGAAGGGFLIDIIYLRLDLPHFHVFTFGIFTGILCLIAITLFIHNTDQLRSPDEEAKPVNHEKPVDSDETSEEIKQLEPMIGEAPGVEEAALEEELEKKKPRGPWEITKAVLSEPIFWRFTVLITLLLGVRAVFLYLGLLFPKFWYRVIGEDAQVGVLQAFNPILVIIGLIAVIPILQKFNVYKMLVFGASITSISMFIPAIPPLGGIGIVEWTYGTTIIFLFVLTVGELIWSPRLSEYTAAIAPEGQEGTYLGLSMVPYFLAKLVVSALSGNMLQRWCPDYPPGEPNMGERIAAGEVPFWDSPYVMWVILGAAALFGTIMAILGKNWFTKGAHFK